MRLFLAGTEIGSHRSLLADLGVKHVALSYMGLRRRVKFSKPWMLDEKFDPEAQIFLDSGAYTVNKDDAEYSDVDLFAISQHYHHFVEQNIDRVDMVSEFDAVSLGRDWIEAQRSTFYDKLPPEKFMAVWHPEWGMEVLEDLTDRYQIVGIPATSLEGRNLTPILNGISARGTRLHGIAMTKIESMKSIRWDSVASTSWISPQHYGDTIVWTGKELKRYPKKYKETARRRHRTLFTKAGFDAAKIAADDPTEVLRLSVWSWLEFEKSINKRAMSNSLPPEAPNEKPETGGEVVDHSPDQGGQNLPTVVRRDTTSLPIVGIVHESRGEDEEDVPVLKIRSDSARVCDNCFLANNCPAYDPGSNCAYNIPITVRTREQFKALRYGMLEMQAQRVMFMKFAEDREGGYADPNLSKEIGLMNKMMKEVEEMEREGFEVTFRARGSQQAAESGMLSRLFGRNPADQMQALETPISADSYIEAEVIETENRGEV